jgi:hypothetical protein
MTNILNKEEKAQIISSHIRNLSFTRYGLEIDIIQENAKNNPQTVEIENFQSQIDAIDNQISALNAELIKVNALVE